MKALVRRIYADPRYAKAFHWGKLITITGGAQAIVQGIALVCGILVIRLLPTQEYAWYTLANTMLGAMSLLADGGISAGVMAQGGKVWQDKEKLGAILATGLALRKKFAVGSLLLATPILMYLLFHHGASWLTIILIIASLVPAFFAALSDSLLEIIPKLHQDTVSLQKNQIIVSAGRLILSSFTLFIFPFTFVAILASGLPRVYGNIGLHKIADVFANKHQKPDLEIRKNILKVVKRILPGAIYYCLSGQITIWLISAFGTTSSIAQVGALGRIAMLLTFFTVLFNTLVIPRFARLPDNKSLLLNRFLQINAGLIFFGVFIVWILYLFSSQALWILGPNYSNLKTEFILNIAGSYISLILATLFALNTSRGWAINPVIAIPFNLITIACGVIFMDISTIRGLFIFNIFVLGAEVLLYSSYGLIKISKINKSEN